MVLPTEKPHSRRKPGSTYPATEPLKNGSRLSPGMRFFLASEQCAPPFGGATQRGYKDIQRRGVRIVAMEDLEKTGVFASNVRGMLGIVFAACLGIAPAFAASPTAAN